MELLHDLFSSPIDFVVKRSIFVAVVFLLTKFHNVDKSLIKIDDKLNAFINHMDLRITKEVTDAKLTVKDNYVSKEDCNDKRSYIYRELDKR